MNITLDRQTELMDFAARAIENQYLWDYHNWDGFIEGEELTEEEWEWLRNNCTVLVDVVKSEDLV